MSDNNRLKRKVLLGMSGGVDSSVAAYLLQKEGYEVIGATMKLWKPGEDNIDNAIIDAKKVADKLGIEHHVIDFEKIFKEKVVKNFIEEYFAGKTPNPCVFCNKHIKFDRMFREAERLGCDYVATGHYAKVEYNSIKKLYELKRSSSDKKDQTYMLYNLNQEKLSKILFPIGNFQKDEIRKIAKEIGLEIHNKPDSQDICFIPNQDYEAFLKEYSNKIINKGNFIDVNGKIIGEHKGIVSYTIGQRKGLGITFGKPTYVIDIDGENNSIILGDNEELFKKELYARDVNFIDYPLLVNDTRTVSAKIRYSSNPSKAVITMLNDNRIKVNFEKPQRAITHGQSVVFYDEDVLVGGGIIE
ncbi:tRNA 2-thiouridine(34) synthase MnmA [Peptostreptococcus canis]|uniref:tRNA-specific 2-thiouridylase MnmA n=1 Tax=Peptostreptococcus canis TaxID=1159213 RepID=A0ABR6TMZ0_9FIRM|nr:tRNA 2-thiouridine(34) synthase MnmA [Peptostreptococcus canis]MBC2576787.1 tRNA 2-thiouridine(34) synthase MnmA [Peptostreptococcus canis]MBP1998910.1 tRNA-specific 2-thiouridylase [Peptostreptococcus canis]